VATTSGSGATSYGFTNEYQSQGLIYLRARHYLPSLGRFLTRDTWDGNVNKPISYNLWLYAYSQPINNFDPTGYNPEETICTIDDPNVYRYCALQGAYEGAYIDVLHWQAASAIAKTLQDDLNRLKGQPNSIVNVSDKGFLKGFYPYTKFYVVNIPNNLQDTTLRDIALGIFMNFENDLEFAESVVPTCYWVSEKNGLIPRCSSFSNEDLPSDYLGFVAAWKGGWSIVDIATKLGGGTRAKALPPELAGTVHDAKQCIFGNCGEDTPYNKCFTSFKLLDIETKKYVHHHLPDDITWYPIKEGGYWKEIITPLHIEY
jgi:RHS repeat-associated protein